MPLVNKTICPLCRREVRAAARWCDHCGRNLSPIRLARPKAQRKTRSYEVIRVGSMFKIVLRGEINIDWLDLKDARSLLALPHSMN